MPDNREDNAKFAAALAGAVGGAAGGIIGAPPLVAAAAGCAIAKLGAETAGSAVRNFKVDNGLTTTASGSLVSFDGEEISTGVGKVNASYYFGKGVDVGSNWAGLECEKPNGDKFNVAKSGLNFGVSDRGVNVGAEVKPIWVENTIGNTKVATGLNLDTGFKANGDGVDVSFLGFGFKAGDGGFGIKTPVFGFFTK